MIELYHNDIRCARKKSVSHWPRKSSLGKIII